MQMATSYMLRENTSRDGQPKSLDQLREAFRSRHYSRRTEGGLMLIRITRRAKWQDRKQDIEIHGVGAFEAGFPRASYKDRNEESRVLCGSI